MRIDLVITELDIGGAERCCVELARFLKARGHEVRVIALGPIPTVEQAALLRLLESAGIESHFLGGTHGWMLPIIAWKLRALLKANRPDVVQSFLWHANILAALVVHAFKIPLVGGERVAEPRRWRHAIGRWAANRMAIVVCVSQGVADWCVRTERIDARKIRIIPNGISSETKKALIEDCELSLPPSAKILLFVGRLEHQKGIDVLLDNAADLLKRLSEHHLVIIGDGAFRSQAHAISERRELVGRVHYLGRRNDVRAWMACSELLLLPTRYEGMPNVILEAMAEGLAIVTTQVEGVRELLGERFNEQSVPLGAWGDFFERVVLLANDRQHRFELGIANRNRVQDQFNLERQLEKYVAIYESLNDRTGQVRPRVGDSGRA
jgi:glycosyltransferase involved in cell wall biosynthesis